MMSKEELINAENRTQKDKFFERRCGVGEVLDMLEEIRQEGKVEK